MSRLVVGVDPGQTTGVFSFVVAGDDERVLPINLAATQIHSAVGAGAAEVVSARLQRADWSEYPPVLAIEKFVVGHRSARSASSGAGELTRDLIGQLERVGAQHRTLTYVRAAAAVKPWATDERLDAAGLLEACAGMRHAKDAARHALYAAVNAGLMPDPLSKKAGSR